jgi:hypothetical protein
MRAFSFRQVHRSLSNVFVQPWRRWMADWANQLLEAASLGSGKLEYLTQSGVSNHTDEDLLRRRMFALNLDPYELGLLDPALLRHLRRCCASCESREACAADLACASSGQAWQGQDDWRDYCENALTLEMLIALQSRSKPAPRYQFPYIP